jgi:hemolysin activation/secretion protein
MDPGEKFFYSRTLLFQLESDFGPAPLDQFRSVGGGSDLRGYAEEAFLAQTGALATAEIRWYPIDRLMLRAFTDNAYLETTGGDFRLTGFGGGFEVRTNLGLVRFDLSVGEEKSLDRLLAHFGFVGEL